MERTMEDGWYKTHTKSGVVTFGETKPLHSKSMKEREWSSEMLL